MCTLQGHTRTGELWTTVSAKWPKYPTEESSEQSTKWFESHAIIHLTIPTDKHLQDNKMYSLKYISTVCHMHLAKSYTWVPLLWRDSSDHVEETYFSEFCASCSWYRTSFFRCLAQRLESPSSSSKFLVLKLICRTWIYKARNDESLFNI